MAEALDLKPYEHALGRRSLLRRSGRVERVTGLIIESRGPRVRVGDLCEIRVGRTGPSVLAEVVGFRGELLQLMAMKDVHGIAAGAEVVASRRPFAVPVGPALLGRVLDAWGRPLDGRPAPLVARTRSVQAKPVPAMRRDPVRERVGTGVRAIDGFLTCGRGQRLGIFSGSGVGKSNLMGMIARNSDSEVSVIALVGERGREVREFVEGVLGPEGLARSVVIVATSDEPAPVRVKAAQAAMTVAEYFRDEGRNVTFLMDSVTRTAMALREIGLAVGEPPTSRGYTPSVFAFLPPFLERAGNGESGSITAFVTVLVEGDDVNDPIGDAVRGILDGHIVLSRDLAARQQYPAIDILQSISRVAPDVAAPDHLSAAVELRRLLATYTHYEDLVTVGAYRKGQNPELDRALHSLPRLRAFLTQTPAEAVGFSEVSDRLKSLAAEAAAWSPAATGASDE